MVDVAIVGVAMVVIGFAVVALSIFTSSAHERQDTETRGAGVLMIGPVPIVFGTDAKWAAVAITLAIVLMALSFMLWKV